MVSSPDLRRQYHQAVMSRGRVRIGHEDGLEVVLVRTRPGYLNVTVSQVLKL